MERIYSLYWEDLSNETQYIFECESKGMTKVHTGCMEPFYKDWKCLKKLSAESFCRACNNYSSQIDVFLYEIGILCLRILLLHLGASGCWLLSFFGCGWGFE